MGLDRSFRGLSGTGEGKIGYVLRGLGTRVGTYHDIEFVGGRRANRKNECAGRRGWRGPRGLYRVAATRIRHAVRCGLVCADATAGLLCGASPVQLSRPR